MKHIVLLLHVYVHATYACVYSCLHLCGIHIVQLHLSLCEHAYGSQQFMLGVFPHFSLPYMLRQNLSLI